MTETSGDFEKMIQSHARIMSSAIRRVCGQRYSVLVPDVQQEVYLALWKQLEGGKTIRHPVSYIYKVALRIALSITRAHRPEVSLDDDCRDAEAAVQSADRERLPAAERSVLLKQALSLLPAEQARALRAHLAGFNHREVAVLYGWSESVARHRIYRGLATLRRAMAEEKDEA
jgi:RNA polymerase sigma factor (sigma-70 family)